MSDFEVSDVRRRPSLKQVSRTDYGRRAWQEVAAPGYGCRLHTVQFARCRGYAYFEALTQTVNVTLARRSAGVPRRSAYDWRENDEDFARRWDEALDEGIDLLEAELQRRAFEGTERPVFYKGQSVRHVALLFGCVGHVPAQGAPAEEIPR